MPNDKGCLQDYGLPSSLQAAQVYGLPKFRGCQDYLTNRTAPAIPACMMQAPTTNAFSALNGLSELADKYDVVLSDIWGVVHDGLKASADACDALLQFRNKGGTVVLITNAPRPSGPIIQQLQQLGAPATCYDSIVTSGDVTTALMAQRQGQSLYHIGPDYDLALVDQAAKLMQHAPRIVPLEQADYILCTGLFNDSVEVPSDYDETLARAKARGLTMICANPDSVVHRGETLVYCGGALGERYKEQGGETIYAGKPYAPIYEACLTKALKQRGEKIDKSRVLAIGDALRTDVAGAISQNLDVLMISNGLHRDEMHDADATLDMARSTAFLQGHALWPTYVMKSLRW